MITHRNTKPRDLNVYLRVSHNFSVPCNDNAMD